MDLDPRNTLLLRQVAFSDEEMRHYADEETVLDPALAIEPEQPGHWKVARARVDYDAKADTRGLHQVIDEIGAKGPDAIKNSANNWLLCALADAILLATPILWRCWAKTVLAARR